MKSSGTPAVDWKTWKPQQRATLLFVIRDGMILLIQKKRGLGAGKINAPGGRIGVGETPLEGAIREVREELRVTPVGVRQRGELRFQFVDGLSLHGYVFTATDCEGEPQETEEAKPLWTSVDEIPYHRMWADDRLWIPLMLEGRYFEGRFLFDGDVMRAYEIDTQGRDPSPRDPMAAGRPEPSASVDRAARATRRRTR